MGQYIPAILLGLLVVTAAFFYTGLHNHPVVIEVVDGIKSSLPGELRLMAEHYSWWAFGLWILVLAWTWGWRLDSSFWSLTLIGGAVLAVKGFFSCRKAQIAAASIQVAREHDSIMRRMVAVNTAHVAGHKIVESIGYIEGLSSIEADSAEGYELAEKDALLTLMKRGEGLGANAVINVKKHLSHYTQQGSAWRVARVSYSGTAVWIAPVVERTPAAS